MVVNAQKIAMICTSGALDYTADAFIYNEDQNRIGCGKTIKALGVYFLSNLDMEAHVQHIERSMRSRYWTLRNLKSNGFTDTELVQVYRTMLRPIVEYACVFYHSFVPHGRTG